MKKIILLLIAVLTTYGFVSCEEDNCPLSTLSLARFNFLDSNTHKSVTLSQGATVTGIAEIADTLNIDTVFNSAQNYMSVPLSYTSETTYVLHYTERMRDTIKLTHKNIPFVSDIECGAIMFYEVQNLSYTTNALDSITLVNPRITNEETIKFNIFYRTSDDE